ncbi:discoidin domain-containing protein [Kribbella sp. NPDC048915]|uniref:discoidin domain-containing protein n=1 Tax=Kribbella sp. NPDC048915 TaxID=3155148 RepID=UPI0034095B5E
MRIPRQAAVLAGTLLTAALISAGSAGAGSAEGGSDAVSSMPSATSAVAVSVTPQTLNVVGLPCRPSTLNLTMTNTGAQDRYADLTLAPTGPLQLSRTLFSSWLPAVDPDQPVSAPVEIRVPRDTAPGAYSIDVRLDRSRLTVPVTVDPLPPKGPGDNLALGEQATASSTHGNFTLCGAVDGDSDTEHWDTLTGWNDGTRAVFPDTYDVALSAPATVSRVELYTLDTAKWPARTNGLRDWDIQARVAGAWQTVAEVRGNTLGHVTTTFTPVTTDAIRIRCLDGNDHAYSRIVELEVYGT